MEDEDEEEGDDDDDDLQKNNTFHFQQSIKIICFKYLSRIIFILFYDRSTNFFPQCSKCYQF